MFETLFDQYNWNDVKDLIYSKTAKDVEQALSSFDTSINSAQAELRMMTDADLDGFCALISPAAAPYLEEMAKLSHERTVKRFGKTMQMYLPMYLSNECQNICTYCGFSYTNEIPRITLSDEQIMKEVTVIKEMGYDNILLVSGEANKTVGVDYFEHAIKLIKPHFSHISLEVQPLEEAEYRRLSAAGLNTVLVYQETYHKDEYKTHHPKGKKSNFSYRLATPDRLGKAGIHKIGLGTLHGLEDWRTDSFFTALHLDYMERTYWKSKYSISFPRLRPSEGCVQPKMEMSDRDLVQLICAYRLFNGELEISLSTRESQLFRNNAIKLGVTSISAGSKTDPGGYAATKNELKQFEIDDTRSPAEIAAMLKANGYEAVWKDWDHALQLAD
jgi:2-iminoacetate synthase